MDLSVILCTIRKNPRFEDSIPSFNIALRTLQEKYLNASVELIIIDGYLWTQKRELPIKPNCEYMHIEPKPCKWQGHDRLTNNDYSGLCSARNTGWILAAGNHTVFFDDCSILDPNFLRRHYEASKRKLVMCGTFSSWSGAKIEDGKIIDFGLPYSSGPADGRNPDGDPAVRTCSGTWLWGMNFSVPLQYTLMVNGNDEMYDGQLGSEDCDFGVRIERTGAPIVYDPSCKIYQLLDTHGDPVPLPEGKKQKELELITGRVAYANEKLIENLLMQPKRVHPQGNHFLLHTARNNWAAYHKLPDIHPVIKDWRDGQPLKEM